MQQLTYIIDIFYPIFGACILVQLGFWTKVWVSVSLKLDHNSTPSGDERDADLPHIQIFIVFKNEANNLLKNLPQILSQEYPSFELILVDDHSTDSSTELIKNLRSQDDRIQLISAPYGIAGKKEALDYAVRKIGEGWMAFTDADCCPSSNQWLRKTIEVNSDESVILGYGPMLKTRGWLNKLIRYETWYIAQQYFSQALSGNAFMGVGRNLFYTKTVFDQVNGFKSHLDLKSGEDDLMVSSLQSIKLGVSLSPESFMYCVAKTRWNDYFQQKRRHATTSFRYSFQTKVLLSLLHSTHLGFVLVGIWGIILGYDFVISLIIAKYIIQMALTKKVMQHFKVEDLWIWQWLLDIIMALFYLILAVSLIKRRNDW